MVKLDKIYTKGGDGGETSLVGGGRVSKHELRPSAFGAVDEVNSIIGVARLYTKDLASGRFDMMLERIQNDLFDLGADLATPPTDSEGKNALRISEAQVKRLEEEIDEMNSELEPLNSFVLPGGEVAAAYIHLGRAHCRRAEREIVLLASKEKVAKEVLEFINRLSDHLFVMARLINQVGSGDILWQPGLNAERKEKE